MGVDSPATRLSRIWLDLAPDIFALELIEPVQIQFLDETAVNGRFQCTVIRSRWCEMESVACSITSSLKKMCSTCLACIRIAL